MKITSIALTLFSLLVAACSVAPQKEGDRPDWLDGPSSKYPASLYLIGRGSAIDFDDAKDRARADLSKQFEVAVQEHSRDEQRFSKTERAGESVESLQQTTARRLVTSAARTIQGIEIADLWHDKLYDHNYVLAVLSKQKARQQFEQEIHSLDDAARQFLKQAELESDPLKRASAVQKAIAAQQQRIAAQSSLQVVDSSGRGLPPTMSLAELVRSRDALLNKVKLHPDTTGALKEELKPILSGRAASNGFVISTANDTDYTLLAAVRLDPAIHKSGWVWLRGTLEISLLSTAGERVGIQRWPLKASSLAVERTKQRLLDDINATLERELMDTILGFVAAQ